MSNDGTTAATFVPSQRDTKKIRITYPACTGNTSLANLPTNNACAARANESRPIGCNRMRHSNAAQT